VQGEIYGDAEHVEPGCSRKHVRIARPGPRRRLDARANKHRFLIIADGEFEPMTSKTAQLLHSLHARADRRRVRPTQAGKTVQQVLGFGGALRSWRFRARPRLGATAVLIASRDGGHSRPNGAAGCHRASSAARDLERLHTFISDDPAGALARERGVRIFDARKPPANLPVADWARGRGRCIRRATVGSRLQRGKMTAQVELRNALIKRGHRTRFVATGQTGIFIEGWGSRSTQWWPTSLPAAPSGWCLRREGRRYHPRRRTGEPDSPGYSGVTLGLLHGSCPDALILCHQATRGYIGDYPGREPWVKIPPSPSWWRCTSAPPRRPPDESDRDCHDGGMNEAEAARRGDARGATTARIGPREPLKNPDHLSRRTGGGALVHLHQLGRGGIFHPRLAPW